MTELTNDQKKNLCINLLKCDDEASVVKILKIEPSRIGIFKYFHKEDECLSPLKILVVFNVLRSFKLSNFQSL